jgi:hypothetical protein
MTKLIKVEDKTYQVTDEEEYNPSEQLLFEISHKGAYTYTIGLWRDILGAPVRKIWKIVGIQEES